MTDTPIKLEAGKVYLMRNGQRTAPMQQDPHDANIFETMERVDDFFTMWRSDGKAVFFGTDRHNVPYDIIAEVVQ